jgi:hypothetical protein
MATAAAAATTTQRRPAIHCRARRPSWLTAMSWRGLQAKSSAFCAGVAWAVFQIER